ncbi:hypothetical protein XENOCAPTIV_028040, partial [Xenoophorus captivus]
LRRFLLDRLSYYTSEHPGSPQISTMAILERVDCLQQLFFLYPECEVLTDYQGLKQQYVVSILHSSMSSSSGGETGFDKLVTGFCNAVPHVTRALTEELQVLSRALTLYLDRCERSQHPTFHHLYPFFWSFTPSLTYPSSFFSPFSCTPLSVLERTKRLGVVLGRLVRNKGGFKLYHHTSLSSRRNVRGVQVHVCVSLRGLKLCHGKSCWLYLLLGPEICKITYIKIKTIMYNVNSEQKL